MNIFTIKKYLALILLGFMPTVAFMIGEIFYGSVWISMAVFFGTFLVFLPLSVLLLKNPFNGLVEGQGLLVVNLDSTGNMTPVLCSLQQPYVKGKMLNQEFEDVYDQNTVFRWCYPEKGAYVEMDGIIYVKMDTKQFNKHRFGMFNFPTLVYNAQIKSCIDKDFLSEIEKSAMAEHTTLYLNRKMEELTSVLRDFSRGVIDLLKPKGAMGSAIWIILGVLAVGAIGYVIYTYTGNTATTADPTQMYQASANAIQNGQVANIIPK